MVGAFLDHLEHDRGNASRGRNASLAAVRSFFRFAALRHPEHAALSTRARYPRQRSTGPRRFLTDAEIDALLAAPDPLTRTGGATMRCCRRRPNRAARLRTGRRAPQTSISVQAATSVARQGQEGRCTPLAGHTVAVLRAWLAERGGGPDAPVFPAPRRPLGRDAVARLLAKHAATRRRPAPPSPPKRHPHVIRHTTAMQLLQAGVDTSVIALWLGHENTAGPDLSARRPRLKERALARTRPAIPPRAATDPPTRCSPSSRRCDYAECVDTDPLPRKRFGGVLGIIRCSALWVLSRVRDNTHRTTDRFKTSRSIRSCAFSVRSRFNSAASSVEFLVCLRVRRGHWRPSYRACPR